VKQTAILTALVAAVAVAVAGWWSNRSLTGRLVESLRSEIGELHRGRTGEAPGASELLAEMKEIRRLLAERAARAERPVGPEPVAAPREEDPAEDAELRQFLRAQEHEAELNRLFGRARSRAQSDALFAGLRTLHRLADELPFTNAGMRADGLLREWKVRDLPLERDNVEEIEHRVRAAIGDKRKAGRALEEAWQLARVGEVEKAAARLRELAKSRDENISREADLRLAVWGVPKHGGIPAETRERVVLLAKAREELGVIKKLLSDKEPRSHERAKDLAEEFQGKYDDTPFAAEARELRWKAQAIWDTEWPYFMFSSTRDRAV